VGRRSGAPRMSAHGRSRQFDREMNAPEPAPVSARRRVAWLAAGAALAVLAGWLPGELPAPARATAATAVFTAWCWLTGCVPIAVASLLPALLLPATGAMAASEVAPSYFHDILMLFLGGFVLAIALERYGVHRRFALAAVAGLGGNPRRLVLGFMAVACVLSMFISNTSTALLMLPVAVAVLEDCPAEHARALGRPLLLGLAYSCSIGGVATPIGTAPNASLIAQLANRFPEAPEIAFGTWFLGAAPFSLAFLLVSWFVLVRVDSRLPKGTVFEIEEIRARRRGLGRRSKEQNRVIAVFAVVALLWMTRRGARFGDAFSVPGWSALLPNTLAATISDSTVALFGMLLLFVLPSRETRSGALLDWADCRRIPWEVLLLLGGGFALARAFEVSGLSAEIGAQLKDTVASLPTLAAVGLTVLVVTFLTELTSNTATINVLLPLFFSASVAAGLHPLLLALPATLAVSCAFMLPVATPPNAILFSSGRLTIAEMARAGFLLNLVTVVFATLFALYWTAPVWGFDLSTSPAWAK